MAISTNPKPEIYRDLYEIRGAVISKDSILENKYPVHKNIENFQNFRADVTLNGSPQN